MKLNCLLNETTLEPPGGLHYDFSKADLIELQQRIIDDIPEANVSIEKGVKVHHIKIEVPGLTTLVRPAYEKHVVEISRDGTARCRIWDCPRYDGVIRMIKAQYEARSPAK